MKLSKNRKKPRPRTELLHLRTHAELLHLRTHHELLHLRTLRIRPPSYKSGIPMLERNAERVQLCRH